MIMMKRETLKRIVQIVITILTAISSTFLVQSCMAASYSPALLHCEPFEQIIVLLTAMNKAAGIPLPQTSAMTTAMRSSSMRKKS